MSYDSPMILNPAGGGSWTLPQLTGQYAASTVRAGTTAFTTDVGQVISNGTSWVSQNQSTAQFYSRKRVAVFGDSHLAYGYRDSTCGTSAGQFVVSGGIATITVNNGSHSFGAGNYVSLQTFGDPSFTLGLNGACTPITQIVSSTAFKVSATYGGVTMPDGDYSNPLSSGSGWVCYSISAKSDGSLFNWMRMLNNDPFDVTAIYALTGQYGVALPYQVSRSAYGPAFDVAVISVGTNDMQTSTTAAATAACYKVFYTLQQAVATLQARGKQVIVQLPIPDTTGNANQKPKAAAEAIFRKLVSNWAGRNNVIVVDAYAQMLDGTVITGAAISAWSDPTSHIHMNSVGMYNIAKLGSISQAMTQNPYNIDYEPVGLIEDNQTYAQAATAWVGSTVYSAGAAVLNGQNVYYCVTGGTSASSGGPTGTSATITDGTVTWSYAGPNSVNIIAHPCMDSSGGGNTTALTGSVPAGWSLVKNGSPTGTTTSNATRTAITGTRSANWGKEWQLAITFSTGGDSVACYQDLFSQMVYGNWYQFGVTVTALNSWGSNVANIECYLGDGGGTSNFKPQANFENAATSTTYPLTTNDVLQLKSEPFYYQSNGSNTNALYVRFIGAGAGGPVNVAVSSAWCRVVQNPNI
jgi:hypothetical protein